MHAHPFRILLVDHSPSQLTHCSVQLEALGIQVMHASSFHQGWRIFDTVHTDAVLCRTSLPDGQPSELFHRIRQHPQRGTTPVSLLLAPTEPDDTPSGVWPDHVDAAIAAQAPLSAWHAWSHTLQKLAHARQALAESQHALQQAQAAWARQVTHDDLTQLGNRRGAEEHLASYLADARREHKPLSLIVCDVDFFKRYNDRLGHQEGDQCLRHVGHMLKQVCKRPLDYAARLSGGQYALLLPNTSPEGGFSFAFALLHHMARDGLFHPDSPIAGHVTLSGGLVCGVPTEQDTSTSWLQRAEQAQLHAKQRGRHRFVDLDNAYDTGKLAAIHRQDDNSLHHLRSA